MSTHASNWIGDDRTLCGVASEGNPGEDGAEPPLFAKPGEVVTCEDCRAVIDHCRKFSGYKEPRE